MPELRAAQPIPDTVETKIWRELGYDDDEIRQMIARKAEVMDTRARQEAGGEFLLGQNYGSKGTVALTPQEGKEEPTKTEKVIELFDAAVNALAGFVAVSPLTGKRAEPVEPPRASQGRPKLTPTERMRAYRKGGLEQVKAAEAELANKPARAGKPVEEAERIIAQHPERLPAKPAEEVARLLGRGNKPYEQKELESLNRARATDEANKNKTSPSEYTPGSPDFDTRTVGGASGKMGEPADAETWADKGRTKRGMTADSTQGIPVPNTGRRPKPIRESDLGTMSPEAYRDKKLGSDFGKQLERAKNLRQKTGQEERPAPFEDTITQLLRDTLSTERRNYDVDTTRFTPEQMTQIEGWARALEQNFGDLLGKDILERAIDMANKQMDRTQGVDRPAHEAVKEHPVPQDWQKGRTVSKQEFDKAVANAEKQMATPTGEDPVAKRIAYIQQVLAKELLSEGYAPEEIAAIAADLYKQNFPAPPPMREPSEIKPSNKSLQQRPYPAK